jgi:hypothetical protein
VPKKTIFKKFSNAQTMRCIEPRIRDVIRWFENCVAAETGGGNPGRPRLDPEVKTLVLKLSSANPLWGAHLSGPNPWWIVEVLY